MKKITGKALSLVLSIALVASGFSASFASAATTTSESGTASINSDQKTVYLSNGGTGDQTTFDLSAWLSSNYTLKTADHQDVTASSSIKQVTSSSASLKAAQASSSDPWIVTIKTPSTTKGTFTLNVLFSGDDTNKQDANGNDYTVTGKDTITVNVLAKGAVAIGAPDTDPAADLVGSYPDDVSAPVKIDVDTNAITNQTVKAEVYTVAPATHSAEATWAAADAVDSASLTPGTPPTTAPAYVVVATPSTVLTDGTLTGSELDYTVPLAKATANNSLRLVAYDYKATAANYEGTKEATANFSVANTVEGTISDIVKGDGSLSGYVLTTSAPIVGASTVTLSTAKTYALVGVNTADSKNVYVDVTGVNVLSSAPQVQVESGKIANLEDDASGAIIIVDDGTVSNITAGTSDDTVSTGGDVQINGGSVGAIDAQDGTVEITSGTVSSVSDASEADVYAGKVGDISATTVQVVPADDESATVVGNITAETVLADSTNASVKTGTITVKGDSTSLTGEVTLTGSATTVGAIDFANYEATLDLSGFVGTISAPSNAAVSGATITSSADVNDNDTNATITGNVAVNQLDLEDGSVYFNGNLKVANLEGGDATLAINAGALTVTDEVTSSNVLKLADASTVVPGTKVYTAADGISDASALTGYGYTQKVTTGTTWDTFYVDTVSFAGLTVTGPSTITLGTTASYTASAYPASQSLPAGYSVEWELSSGDTSFFDLETNGSTATLKALQYDTTFSSENQATLTAHVVDEYGLEADDTYSPASINVTIVQTPAFTSDTTSNFNLASGSTYRFAITSSDGTAPTFGVGSSALTYKLYGTAGNTYYYNVTAAGKVGDQVGVYLGGTRLLVITIGAPAVKTDTPAAISVTAGQSYQFKVTAGVTGTPVYTSGTPSAVSIASSKVVGSDHFFTVKAVGKAGQAAGIYVNGVRVCVVTVK